MENIHFTCSQVLAGPMTEKNLNCKTSFLWMLNVFCCKSQKFAFNKNNFIMNLVGKHVKMSEVVGEKKQHCSLESKFRLIGQRTVWELICKRVLAVFSAVFFPTTFCITKIKQEYEINVWQLLHLSFWNYIYNLLTWYCTVSCIAPRCTGICGALATSPPSGPNIAQEKSNRSWN